MKPYGEVEFYIHTSITSEVDGNYWLPSRSGERALLLIE